MYCSQAITQTSRLPVSNNFYCKKTFFSSVNSNYQNLSQMQSWSSLKVLAFGLPDLHSIPVNLNNSFQEAIVISTINDNNIFADVTNSWIKMHKDKNHYSLFYKEIFKALLTKQIHVIDSPIGSKDIDNKIILIQQYIWKKGLKSPQFNSIARLNKNVDISNISTKFIMEQLSTSPVFVVKNGLNEIILGHPLSRIRRTAFNQIASSLSNLFHQPIATSPISNGLFFFHPDDAIEFKNFVQSKAPEACKDMDIKIQPVGLHVAYKMNRNFSSDIQFRFVPDFKEVGDLIFRHQQAKNLHFHENQYYGKNFFQGQPIYMIQPIIIKHRNGRISIIKFTGANDDREVVFTNLEAANKSWANFIKRTPYLKRLKKPNLLVYNLESFLKDKEVLHKADLTKFIVVTNKSAYITTKESVTLPYHNGLSKHLELNVKPKLFFVKLWIRRLLFTLTYE
uniref:Uncharacterized protein ycf80 n=1 Tax=Porphyra purpurea TaxID=2787 RepID=YCF80_PORPU|nr:hypothetical protein PopuCp033 [Porphyra purpurea]P51218.1 RecName: Full=Uncharacterized protein ycf80; AltName: Full=ORF450 [Porphyra purpurea]AAC08104.1 ORF450 [Porphyra purpurea]